MQQYLYTTSRVGLSIWLESDLELASSLWGNKDVMQFLSSDGFYTAQQIKDRLSTEIENYNLYNVQYWKLYELETSQFMGCCGLKPYNEQENAYELGFQLLPQYWGKSYAEECSRFCLSHALSDLHATNIFAAHHPDNLGSKKLLTKLGFEQWSVIYYEPTGLEHPYYKYSKIV